MPAILRRSFAIIYVKLAEFKCNAVIFVTHMLVKEQILMWPRFLLHRIKYTDPFYCCVPDIRFPDVSEI
jgi:hypothetical protein